MAGLAKADNQPHMHTALDHLHAAKHSLDEATPDKGGHRTKALELVESAISQVQQGINYANKH